jgi:hypothetical protein
MDEEPLPFHGAFHARLTSMLYGLPERSPLGRCRLGECVVNGATVLHYDRDFDVIAEVTGQRALWVVPPGSIP